MNLTFATVVTVADKESGKLCRLSCKLIPHHALHSQMKHAARVSEQCILMCIDLW
jgi:hypothetical protein